MLARACCPWAALARTAAPSAAVASTSKVVPRRCASSSTQHKASQAYLSATHKDDAAPADVSAKLARFASATLATYARPPFILTRGKRCTVWDTQGREYLDFTGGIAVNALGHADEGVQRVMNEQAGQLVHSSNLYHNEWSGELALLIVRMTKQLGGLGFAPGSEAPETESASVSGSADASQPNPSSGLKVFLSNSGTEANEGALKFARKWGKQVGGDSKTEIVSFRNGFHGRSMGALSATWQEKYQKPFSPLIPDMVPATVNDIDSLQTVTNDKTCGVIIEPIQVRFVTLLTGYEADIRLCRAREAFLRRRRSSCELCASAATRLARFSSTMRFK